MDEMRKAFEAWVQDLGWNAARLKPDGILNGVYKNATTQGLWRAWQAACAVEREVCAQVCQERAEKCEHEAQEASANGEQDESVSLRATAWQLTVCAAEIEARGRA